MFGDADRRRIQRDTQMRCHPEPPWMGDTVPIDQHEVGAVRQLIPGSEQRGHFAEAKIAGHIGQGRGHGRRRALQQFEIRPAQDDDSSMHEASWIEAGATDIDACDESDGRQIITDDNALGHSELGNAGRSDIGRRKPG